MDNEPEFAPTPAVETAESQTSLVGPAAAAEHDAEIVPQVGLPAPTPEEMAIIHAQLQKKSTPGLYSNEQLLSEAKSETGHERKPLKNRDGQWVHPGDAQYDALSTELDAGRRVHGDEQPAAPALTADAPVSQGDKAQEQKEMEERQQVKAAIQTIAAVDEGSKDPHRIIDEIALKQVLAENSTMKLKDTLGILAAVDKVAFAGVEDIDPSKIVADPIVRGPGADRAYAAAQAKKQERNDQFVQQQKARERALGGDKS